jgi:hypothetical protein
MAILTEKQKHAVVKGLGQLVPYSELAKQVSEAF